MAHVSSVFSLQAVTSTFGLASTLVHLLQSWAGFLFSLRKEDFSSDTGHCGCLFALCLLLSDYHHTPLGSPSSIGTNDARYRQRLDGEKNYQLSRFISKQRHP
jgi:hypothetical protein